MGLDRGYVIGYNNNVHLLNLEILFIVSAQSLVRVQPTGLSALAINRSLPDLVIGIDKRSFGLSERSSIGVGWGSADPVFFLSNNI